MLRNESLWKLVQRCHEVMESAGIPHAVAGGVAVCLHGYQRDTTEIEWIIRREDFDRTRDFLKQSGLAWKPKLHEFHSKKDIPVRFFFAGERAGNDDDVVHPDPGVPKAVTTKEGLPTLSLPRLIEVKLACGTGSLRRTHKDFADVVELIAIKRLEPSFARFLHKSVRKTFRELVARAVSDS